MKKNYPVPLLLLFMSLAFYTCKKDYSPGDAVDDKIKLNQQALKDSMIRDSLRKVSGVIAYSVNIVDGSDAGFSSKKSTSKVKAIANAKVTAVQYGKTFTVTDSAGTGIVTFKDLRMGTVSVKVQADNFTECSYIAQLYPMTGMDTMAYRATRSDVWNLVRYVGTMIPLFPTTGDKMATVSGVLTYQSDLTNAIREKAANVDIFGVIDVDQPDFVQKYMASYEDLSNNFWTGSSRPEINYYGHIVKIAYNSIVFKGTTNDQGEYSVKVPATGDGLPIRMEISDVAINQTLLLNTIADSTVHGLQSVRTLFSSSLTPATASTIPSVAAAYCTFTAPTGNGTSNEPTSTATATAIVSESGIVSLTVSNPGLGYTQAPKVVITGNAGVITPASATPVLDADGRVSDITLNNPGLGYSNATVTLSGSESITAVASPVLTHSVQSVSVVDGGSGYNVTAPPQVTIYSNSGTGALAKANLKGYIESITINNGGSGYTVAPEVIVSGDGAGYEFTAVLTGNSVTGVNVTTPIPANVKPYSTLPTITFVSNNGPGATPAQGSGATATVVLNYHVTSIDVTNQGSGYLTGDAKVVIASPTATTGTTAQASGEVALTSKGVLSKINVANPGLGYTAAPVVTITGGGASVDATATAIVANGQVTGFTITNPGEGYTGDPTVNISTFKTAASATALCHSLAGKIIGIELTGNGEGYQVAPVVEFYYNSTITGNSNGTNATATATINLGRVTDVAITDGGTGYFAAPLVRFRMPNVNVIAKATLSITADGYVNGITLDSNPSGYGYESAPTITISPAISGKGSGAHAIVTSMDNGRVTGVKIDNRGSGYVARNYMAGNSEGFSIYTPGSPTSPNINTIPALTGKTYIRDIYLGTGQRYIGH